MPAVSTAKHRRHPHIEWSSNRKNLESGSTPRAVLAIGLANFLLEQLLLGNYQNSNLASQSPCLMLGYGMADVPRGQSDCLSPGHSIRRATAETDSTTPLSASPSGTQIHSLPVNDAPLEISFHFRKSNFQEATGSRLNQFSTGSLVD